MHIKQHQKLSGLCQGPNFFFWQKVRKFSEKIEKIQKISEKVQKILEKTEKTEKFQKKAKILAKNRSGFGGKLPLKCI